MSLIRVGLSSRTSRICPRVVSGVRYVVNSHKRPLLPAATFRRLKLSCRIYEQS
ncbi:hypothetical protein P153DRAFT_364048 [Dothidotthia symphoricarpi CBS 119687]|uniref:Sema domain-containing protein n=1 Tax=Dothidotthia symphoricarpi CBS 119687 TaxID=1392245 RepID=A0A6A6APA7_9PLEO|nr:uncharacterized protein P153DRAFT_364048 [Dothidotthia symphoricarpi CBS 119687]KAF2132774.1 hypothetical protein P153DRAFT_364048 [Dothidotthia symphoricarpi CBS 119687]